MTIRVAHITDIHFTESVPLRRLLRRLPGKRMLGTANQVLRGRRHHFPEDVQRALVDHLMLLNPDLVVITGDLTAQALESEFEKARAYLQPVLDALPTVVMPGNHDLYTRGARDTDRIASYFGEWMYREGAIGRYSDDNVDVVTLDPNRPTFINASGIVPDEQLQALRAYLSVPSVRPLVLGLHYPLVDRHGQVYDGNHHGLLNARAVIQVLEQAARKPTLILHGHEHHGFRQTVAGIPIFDCGSSGYRFMPEKRRAAAMCVYHLGAPELEVERFLHDGARFEPEAGGAFATGR